MKNILKSGMIVELRNGIKYLVVDNYLIGYFGHMSLINYNTDLTYYFQGDCAYQTDSTLDKCLSQYDIMKIWTQKDMTNMASMLENKVDPWTDRFGTLIYDRDNAGNEIVEMTVEEICKALGKNVKVVK